MWCFNHTRKAINWVPRSVSKDSITRFTTDSIEIIHSSIRIAPVAATHSRSDMHPRCAGHRLLAVLGRRNARRWISFRPCRGSGPDDGDAFRTDASFLQSRRGGIDASLRQNDRRTLGTWVRRLSTQSFSRRLVEWNDRIATRCAGFGAVIGRFGRFAERFAGSSDLFRAKRSTPTPAINYRQLSPTASRSTTPDGQREAQRSKREENRDGHNHNLSWNCGVEGPTRAT